MIKQTVRIADKKYIRVLARPDGMSRMGGKRVNTARRNCKSIRYCFRVVANKGGMDVIQDGTLAGSGVKETSND